MKNILIAEIKLARFRDPFICKRCEVLQDQSANENVDRGVRPRVRLLTVKRSKNMLIDPCKDMI